MATIKVDGVGYNVEVIKKMSLRQFVDHEMHDNHLLHIKDAAEKRRALSSAYFLIVGKRENKKKEQE